jgi:pre-mRNA-splicing factor ATP-dependent RNA helicase DHX38/PRP16
MTGQEEIEACCFEVKEQLERLDGAPELLILPIYSQLPSDLQVRPVVCSRTLARASLVAVSVRQLNKCGTPPNAVLQLLFLQCALS